jgi:hypothetical protein
MEIDGADRFFGCTTESYNTPSFSYIFQRKLQFLEEEKKEYFLFFSSSQIQRCE